MLNAHHSTFTHEINNNNNMYLRLFVQILAFDTEWKAPISKVIGAWCQLYVWCQNVRSIVIAFGMSDLAEAGLNLIVPQCAMTKYDRLQGNEYAHFTPT